MGEESGIMGIGYLHFMFELMYRGHRRKGFMTWMTIEVLFSRFGNIEGENNQFGFRNNEFGGARGHAGKGVH